MLPAQQTPDRESEPFRGLEVIDACASPAGRRPAPSQWRSGRVGRRLDPGGTESTGSDDDHSFGQVGGYS